MKEKAAKQADALLNRHLRRNWFNLERQSIYSSREAKTSLLRVRPANEYKCIISVGALGHSCLHNRITEYLKVCRES